MFRALKHRHFLPFVGTTFAVGAFCRYQYQKPNKPLIMMMTNTKTVEPVFQTTDSTNYDVQKLELIMTQIKNCKDGGDVKNLIEKIPKSIKLTKDDVVYFINLFEYDKYDMYGLYDFLERRINLTFDDKIYIVEHIEETKTFYFWKNNTKKVRMFNYLLANNSITMEEYGKLISLYSTIETDKDNQNDMKRQLIRRLK